MLPYVQILPIILLIQQQDIVYLVLAAKLVVLNQFVLHVQPASFSIKMSVIRPVQMEPLDQVLYALIATRTVQHVVTVVTALPV